MTVPETVAPRGLAPHPGRVLPCLLARISGLDRTKVDIPCEAPDCVYGPYGCTSTPGSDGAAPNFPPRCGRAILPWVRTAPKDEPHDGPAPRCALRSSPRHPRRGEVKSMGNQGRPKGSFSNTGMNLIRKPLGKKGKQRMARQENRWAKRSSEVKITKLTPEQLAEKLAQLQGGTDGPDPA